jgi:hypothetical protein
MLAGKEFQTLSNHLKVPSVPLLSVVLFSPISAICFVLLVVNRSVSLKFCAVKIARSLSFARTSPATRPTAQTVPKNALTAFNWSNLKNKRATIEEQPQVYLVVE